jgi:hypothetical protein|tara:strand:+ start:406 stop:888 length:483 start_codon:yes stop_codon:yes gene_type:complete
MPSFDIQSELDTHEVTNAVDQAQRVIDNRFDFKGSEAAFDLLEREITLLAKEEFQIHQMMSILQDSLAKRKIDLKCLKEDQIETSTGRATQKVMLREGIDQSLSKKITMLVKQSKIKVQASIQGTSIRISGKKRDDLQLVMQEIKEANFNMPLQYVNFRD